jgi:eukaryotic-like serine/threonine-protein kinase
VKGAIMTNARRRNAVKTDWVAGNRVGSALVMPSPSLLAGRYRLETRIAAGGAGEVWRAADTVLARPVAVKLLRAEYTSHAETLTRFRAEARAAGSLSHPAIARVYDYGEPDPPQPPFLVMELVNGPSLAGLLASGPLDPGRAMDVVAQVAAGLQVAHADGLVHRDIKPANLLLDPTGQVKITDFGIAYAAGSSPVTRTGMVVGTPAYLAPERVSGASATAATDLYSLGVVAYECLTGAPPFSGAPVEVAVAHRDRPLPELPPAVPAEVARLVAELTAKDPAARPAGAGEVARRAGHLRDSISGATDAATSPLYALPVTLADIPAAGAGPVTASAPDTLIGSALPAWAGEPAPRRPWRDVLLSRWSESRWGALRPRTAAAAAAAVAVLVLLTAVIAALSAGSPPGPARPSAQQSGTVGVSPGSLIGQPLALARQRLQQLGLTVRVQWHPSHQQPGTVVSVEPSGQVPAASTVVLTVASPHGHGNGDGHGNGNGQGGDGGGG